MFFVVRILNKKHSKIQNTSNTWACMEVIPSIRRTGTDMNMDKSTDYSTLIEDNEANSIFTVNHFIGERALYYVVVRHIRRTYMDAFLISGLGENRSTYLVILWSFVCNKKG